jgi:hypothetical protein
MAVMRRATTSSPQATSRTAGRRQPPIQAGYEHFRLEREGALVSRATLEFYDTMVLPFLAWLDGEGVQRFDHLDVTHARVDWRLASTPGHYGRQRQPATLHGSHRAIGTFLRWAIREGYPIDGRILTLEAPRIPGKEPTIYHVAQVRRVLAACNPNVPTEDTTVRRGRDALEDLALSTPSLVGLRAYLEDHPEMPLANRALNGALEVPNDLLRSAIGGRPRLHRDLLEQIGERNGNVDE